MEETFEEKIVSKLREKKLSDSSIKNYIRNLEILNGGKEFKNLNFLAKKVDIYKMIEQKKGNTQRSYYIAIVSVLNSIKGDDKKLEKLYRYYYDKMMDINSKLREVQSQNVKSETQEKNWIEWDVVKKTLDDMVDEVKKFGKSVTKTEYMKVLKMIILSLYVLQAPRRNQDYQFMNVVKNKVPVEEINYLVMDKKQFWFRKYKTAKKEIKGDVNEIKIDVSDALFDNIKLYFKYHPLIKNKITAKMNVPFLVDSDGEALKNVNSITYILNSIFDKNIGSSMLRHLFLSQDKYRDHLDKMKELEKVSKEMSHSTGMQKEYIKV